MIMVEEATDIVREYLRPFARREPICGKLEFGAWCIKINIGLLKPKIVEFKVSPETGNILRAR